MSLVGMKFARGRAPAAGNRWLCECRWAWVTARAWPESEARNSTKRLVAPARGRTSEALAPPSLPDFLRKFHPHQRLVSYYRRLNTDSTNMRAHGDETHRRASDSVHADTTVTPTAAP
jgi:hypothetical protein